MSSLKWVCVVLVEFRLLDEHFLDVDELLFDLFFFDFFLIVRDDFKHGGILFREILIPFLIELD